MTCQTHLVGENPAMESFKKKLLSKALLALTREHAALAKALSDSSAAATDPGSKAEGKYDTRSLEMSYLAAGQARQAESLTEAMQQLERFELPQLAITDAIDLGALVEVEREGEWSHYFLLPAGGGIEIEEEGVQVTTVTPESPLFSQLEGKRIGEVLENSGTVSEVS